MPETPYRDRTAFEAIASALAATGQFASIGFGTPAEIDAIGADRVPAVVILPLGWSELPETLTSAVRQVRFTLTIVVRGVSAAERFRQLERLTALAQNALAQSSLAGGSLPAFTTVEQGRYELALKHIEGRAILTGEFTYPVPDTRARAVAP